MQKFLKACALFALILVAVIITTTAVRVCLAQSAVAESMKMTPRQKYLFIGDSHTGCIIAERERFSNKVLWKESLPPQFSLMRLRDMERIGALKDVKILFQEIWLQNIGFQRKSTMLKFWFTMLPISWRHFDALPIRAHDAARYLPRHFMDDMGILAEERVQDISILTRSPEEMKWDLKEVTSKHFNFNQQDDQLCEGCDESLRSAISEIKAICNRNNVKLIYFSAPVTSYYRSIIPSSCESELQSLISHVKSLEIPYYDFRDAMSDEWFRDCFHLTYSGTEKFTEKFFDVIGGVEQLE